MNIGNNRSEKVSRLLALLEAGLGRPAVVRHVPRPAADVIETWASVDRIARTDRLCANDAAGHRHSPASSPGPRLPWSRDCVIVALEGTAWHTRVVQRGAAAMAARTVDAVAYFSGAAAEFHDSYSNDANRMERLAIWRSFFDRFLTRQVSPTILAAAAAFWPASWAGAACKSWGWTARRACWRLPAGQPRRPACITCGFASSAFR